MVAVESTTGSSATSASEYKALDIDDGDDASSSENGEHLVSSEIGGSLVDVEGGAAALDASAPSADDANSIVPSPDASITASPTVTIRTTLYDLFQAAVVGVLSGLSVAIFKLSIEAVRELCYNRPTFVDAPALVATVPAFGGVAVGALLLLGAFPPGLRGTVKEVDNDAKSPVRDLPSQVRSQLSFVRKSVAAIFTLGTGCSLGPEGPCVEIGMSVSRAVMDIKPRRSSLLSTLAWNRLLLSCGAAAGVAAGA